MHFTLSAINKLTEKYENPYIANKIHNYICPECNNDVILKQGTIKRYHFCHKKSISCNYYDHPSESQIHKDAKRLIKQLIESNKKIEIKKKCLHCNHIDLLEIPDYDKDCDCIIEHSFKFKGSKKIADLAFLDKIDNSIICIFEILNTHNTNEEDRPEPWFEINSHKILKKDLGKDIIKLTCCRKYICESCQKNTKSINTGYYDYDSKKDRHYFIVPFSEKENFKELKGYWDSDLKLWYIDNKYYNKKYNYGYTKLIIKFNINSTHEDFHMFYSCGHFLKNNINNIREFKTLIQYCNDINFQDNEGKTILMCFIQHIHQWSLSMNFKDFDFKIFCKLLIESGTDINIKDNNGRTALMYLFINNIDDISDHKDFIKIYNLLIQNGSNINTIDIEGKSCLIHSVQNFHGGYIGNIKMCQILINSGIDVNIRDNKNNSALFYAESFLNKETNNNKIEINKEIINILINAGSTSN